MIFQSVIGGSGSGGLGPALAVSCTVHLLLLWPEAVPHAAREGGQPLHATLRAAAVAQPQAQPAIPAAPEAMRPAPRPAMVPRLASAAMSPAQAPAALPAEERAPPETPPAGPGAAPPAEGGGGISVETGVADGEGLRAYRIGLAREARAHKRYPLLARERGWSGTAEVRVDVSPDGRPQRIELAQSSGHALLDREALAMMTRAAAATPSPESLRGHAFAVSLPVVFDLGGE